MKSKVLTIIASIAIAFGLWFYVITVEHTQVETTFYNIPVVLDGKSILNQRGLMITSETDLKVNLRLSGNRTNLNKLKNSDITVLADLTRIYEEGQKELQYEVSFPGSTSIEVMNRDPATITITVEKMETKEIPVELAMGIGSIPAGFELLSSRTDLETVTIRGPKRVVDQIHMAKVILSAADIAANRIPSSDIVVIDKQFALCDAQGTAITDVSDITVNNGTIRTELQLSKVKEVPFTYEIVPGGGLTAQDVKITLSNAAITVGGSEAEIDALQSVSLGLIDLSNPQIQNGVPFVRALNLSGSLTNISGITEVSITVTFVPEMTVEEVTVPSSQFVAQNLPEGLIPQYLTLNLPLTLRGTAAQMQKLDVSKITVYVDMTGMTAGNKRNCPVTVQVEGADRIGALGDPVVNVNMLGA